MGALVCTRLRIAIEKIITQRIIEQKLDECRECRRIQPSSWLDGACAKVSFQCHFERSDRCLFYVLSRDFGQTMLTKTSIEIAERLCSNRSLGPEQGWVLCRINQNHRTSNTSNWL